MSAVVYRHFDASGKLLYVGCSISVIKRTYSHERGAQWFKSIATITLEHFDTLDQARDAERIAITTNNPPHNVAFAYLEDGQPKAKPKGKKCVMTDHQIALAQRLKSECSTREDVIKASHGSNINLETMCKVLKGVPVRECTLGKIQGYFNYKDRKKKEKAE